MQREIIENTYKELERKNAKYCLSTGLIQSDEKKNLEEKFKN